VLFVEQQKKSKSYACMYYHQAVKCIATGYIIIVLATYPGS